MDDAKLRRGEPTVYAKHGVARAITVGDYLFVKGYELSALDLNPETIRLVADACARLADGQYREEDLKASPEDADLYLHVVENKTAGFIATCSEIGAHLAGLPATSRRPYREYGYHLGVAFQLIDDVLDATGTVEKLGKDVGNDVRNGAKGGPAVFALLQAGGGLGRIVQEIYQTQGVGLTRELAEAFARRAQNAADRFPQNAYSRALWEVAAVLLSRES